MNRLPDRTVRFCASLYYVGLRLVGATTVRRRWQDGGLILCYHNVTSREHAAAGDPGLHLSSDRFEQQVRWLAAHYDVVSLGEFADRAAGTRTLRGTAAITFDDGYAGVFDHAVPVLKALRVPATVFVVAEAPGKSRGFWWDRPEVVARITPERQRRWLTDLRGDESAILSEIRDDAAGAAPLPDSHRPADWATIRANVGGGVEIGAHSSTHRSLPALSDVELHHEIVTSRALIQQGAGVCPEFFAYPYGLSNARARALVREAGYRAGLVLDSLRPPADDSSALPRVNIPAGISQAAFEAWTSGFRSRGRH
jgi:peptidoglycan/xylan/chitin deacetylase (PgdA/CDA1 family)